MGNKGSVIAKYNEDEVFLHKKGCGKIEIGITDKTPVKQPAYKTIVDGVFEEKLNPCDVTIPLETGLKSLKLIEKATNTLKNFQDYEQGTIPNEFTEIKKLL